MEEADQDRTLAGEATSGETERPVKRSESIRTEVADDGSLEPGPGALDRIELGGIGGQSHDSQPALLAFDEATRGQAAVRVDAVPDHDDRATVVLMEMLQEADDVFGTNGARHQGEEEPSSTRVS